MLLGALRRTILHPLRAKRFHLTTSCLIHMAGAVPMLPLFEALASRSPQRLAVVHSASGQRFTYGGLLDDVTKASDDLRRHAGNRTMDGERIAFLVENGYDYVVTLLSIFSTNSVALPLAPSFPASELKYIMENSGAMMLLSSVEFQSKAKEVIGALVDRPPIWITVPKRPSNYPGSPTHCVNFDGVRNVASGMMLYTSGTTNRPKGVLLPESALTAQAQSLVKAWNYRVSDHLLHVLPLHHVHGIVNALLAPLFAGSCIEFLFPFNATAVWNRLASPFLPKDQRSSPSENKITFLTVVPTIYTRLLSSHPSLPANISKATKLALDPSSLRLNISGSAALPTPTKAAWAELSGGNILLERYGMTEVGMALSCGLSFNDRVDGSVGWPLPSVEVRLVDTETHEVIELGAELDQDGKEREGEIQLRGPTVFREYWANPKATKEEFVDDDDGKGLWFKTGDIATRKQIEGTGQSTQEWAKGPMYFIRGRKSVDIFKTGGEKVSALEIERELLSLPQIVEAAVVGLPSEQWGQKIAAVVVLKDGEANSGRGGKTWGLMDMRRALKDRLVNYKIPQELRVVEQLPRNAMGKVNKKALIKEIFGESV